MGGNGVLGYANLLTFVALILTSFSGAQNEISYISRTLTPKIPPLFVTYIFAPINKKQMMSINYLFLAVKPRDPPDPDRVQTQLICSASALSLPYLWNMFHLSDIYMYRTVYSFRQNINADRFRAVGTINTRTIKLKIIALTIAENLFIGWIRIPKAYTLNDFFNWDCCLK